MSRHSLGQKKDDGMGTTLLWVLAGGAAGVGLYYLLKPKAAAAAPGATRAAPLAPIEPPAAFANLDGVSTRFSQVIENYRMGRFTPQEAIAQTDGLIAAIRLLVARGAADRTMAANLVSRLEDFKSEVRGFMAEQGVMMRQGQLGRRLL